MRTSGRNCWLRTLRGEEWLPQPYFTRPSAPVTSAVMGRLSLGLWSIVVYVPSNRRLERNLVPDRPAYSKLYPWDSNHSCQPRMCPEGGPVNTFSLLNMKSQFRKRLWGRPGLALVRRTLLASQSLDRVVLLLGHPPGPRPHLLLLLCSNIFLFYFLENAVYILPALFGGPALLLDFRITLNQVCSFFKRQLKVTPSVKTCKLFQEVCVLIFPQLFHPLFAVRGRLPVCLTRDSSLAHLARSRVSAEVCGMNG